MAVRMRAPPIPTEVVDALECTLDLSKQKTGKMRMGAAGATDPTSWPNPGPRRHPPHPAPSPGPALPVDLLVVPHSKVDIVMQLAHSNSLEGHLVCQNTLKKIKDCFIWPWMSTEVRNFCQHCPQCQRVTPHQPVSAPLVLIPIISVPFKRVGMDLVGPPLKSTQDHKYILVIMDYATHYPRQCHFERPPQIALPGSLFCCSPMWASLKSSSIKVCPLSLNSWLTCASCCR